jgi:hypothetical protein
MKLRSIIGLTILTTFPALAAGLAGTAVTEGGVRNPVLEYYWKMAGETFAAQDPAVGKVSYSFRSRSYYYTVASNGVALKTDSLVVDHVIGVDGVDSQTVVAGGTGRFGLLDLEIPNIFRDPYHIHFYPNDTGGASLAIGFRADSTMPQLPDGLAIIDRNEYVLRRLYLYYPNKPDCKRFTRTFRFTLRDGLIFADSISDVAARFAIFSLENYRIETGISDIRVLSPAIDQ